MQLSLVDKGGMVHKSKLKRISLAVCFALMSLGAEAAGLGKLTVLSGLGEPLNAEIELLATSSDDLSSLSAIIAPEEAYKVQGIERPALHSTVKIEIKKNPSGSAYLKLSSNQPVTDPYLDMLIQVDWASGRLLREYTLLLDPPGYAQSPSSLPSVSSPATSIKLATAAAASSDTSGNATKPSKKHTARNTPAPAAKPEISTEDETKVTTAKGNTLYSIARQANVQNVSLDQVLLGIYKANKDAFIGNNMNRLKTGQILRVPSSSELAAIPKPEAAQEIRVQSSDFQSYRNKLAGSVEAAPAMSDDEGKKSSGGKITKAAEDKATPAASGPKDVVKLSKGVSGDTKALQDKVTGLQEEATAKEKAIQDANDHVAALEKQVADMQKLLVLKNQSMANLQKNAADNAPIKAEAAAPAQPVATPVPVTPPVVAPPEATKPADAAPAPTPVPAPVPEKKPEPVKKVMPPPVPVEEPSLFDDLSLPLVGGAGAVLLALIGGWLVLRNKRRRSLDGFEKDILTSGGLKANTVFGNTLGGTVDSGDTSFLTDFTPGSGMIDTHDVDPIAEAEVYMAYGRDSQAEEILKDAIVKEPKRHELHLKLLEMYAARKDSSAFETVAGELYSTLGTSDPVWAKVATLGRSFEPENPLYEATESSAAPVAATALATAAVVAASADDDSLMGDSDLDAADSTLDFSLDPVEIPASDSSAVEDNVLDFDLGANAAEASVLEESHASTTEMQAIKTDDDFSADAFDLDIGAEAEKPAESNDLDFQLDLPEAAAADTVQLDIGSFDQAPSIESERSFVDLANAADGADYDKTIMMNLPDLVAEPAEKEPEIDFSANEISFDLPEIKAAEVEPATLESAEPDAFSLDLPEVAETAIEVEALPDVFELDIPEISHETPAEVIAPAEAEIPDFEKTTIINSTDVNEIEFGSTAEEPSFDLDLDVDFASLDTEEMDMSEHKATDEHAVLDSGPEIDLSGISLDLDTTPEVAESITSSESSEVDTKLDLVTAYMDMGDNEGARELLDEVLKEGGVQQRLKAQDILKSLS